MPETSVTKPDLAEASLSNGAPSAEADMALPSLRLEACRRVKHTARETFSPNKWTNYFGGPFGRASSPEHQEHACDSVIH